MPGDIVLRDKEGRIIAFWVGTETETWNKIQSENPGSYIDYIRVNKEGGIL